MIGGAAIAAVGLLPRWADPVSWAVLLASILLGPLFGPDLGLLRWVLDLSPFTHTPKAPAAEITAAPVAALIAAFITLAVAGLATAHRRGLVLPA
ncbi:hypothetical protein ACFYO0_40855 [Streptomyces sp. NPDC006365]|uniref:hypothetical protein n=1 Tax=Streptomyces sp. NPDC006365 TaxID=3364744 RepID=UPI0036BD8BF7